MSWEGVKKHTRRLSDSFTFKKSPTKGVPPHNYALDPKELHLQFGQVSLNYDSSGWHSVDYEQFQATKNQIDALTERSRILEAENEVLKFKVNILTDMSSLLLEHVQIGHYAVEKTIGKGAYGTVSRARSILTDQLVAIKTVPKVHASQLATELESWKQLHHKNIVQLYEIIVLESAVYLVMEYCDVGEMYEYLSKCTLEPENVKIIFKQLVDAVSYCHSVGIVHRDLKLENILLHSSSTSSFPTLKLSDFSFSVSYTSIPLKTFCGTTPYAAPEILKGESYFAPPVDIWSLGVLLYIFIFKEFPFDYNKFEDKGETEEADGQCIDQYTGESYPDVVVTDTSGNISQHSISPLNSRKQQSHDTTNSNSKSLAHSGIGNLNVSELKKFTWKLELPRKIDDELQDLMMRMLEPDPRKRITGAEVLKHKWLCTDDGVRNIISGGLVGSAPSLCEPFTSAEELCVIQNLKNLGINVDGMMESVKLNLCDQKAGFWYMLVEKQRNMQLERTRISRKSIDSKEKMVIGPAPNKKGVTPPKSISPTPSMSDTSRTVDETNPRRKSDGYVPMSSSPSPRRPSLPASKSNVSVLVSRNESRDGKRGERDGKSSPRISRYGMRGTSSAGIIEEEEDEAGETTVKKSEHHVLKPHDGNTKIVSDSKSNAAVSEKKTVANETNTKEKRKSAELTSGSVSTEIKKLPPLETQIREKRRSIEAAQKPGRLSPTPTASDLKESISCELKLINAEKKGIVSKVGGSGGPEATPVSEKRTSGTGLKEDKASADLRRISVNKKLPNETSKESKQNSSQSSESNLKVRLSDSKTSEHDTSSRPVSREESRPASRQGSEKNLKTASSDSKLNVPNKQPNGIVIGKKSADSVKSQSDKTSKVRSETPLRVVLSREKIAANMETGNAVVNEGGLTPADARKTHNRTKSVGKVDPPPNTNDRIVSPSFVDTASSTILNFPSSQIVASRQSSEQPASPGFDGTKIKSFGIGIKKELKKILSGKRVPSPVLNESN
ncbi:hypothetical protein HK098_005152 [Nowakowskiella sp. JEL0407]|nr:hypothetical protein HK098_005152 [Nowakowskiella sp. JEL0407]